MNETNADKKRTNEIRGKTSTGGEKGGNVKSLLIKWILIYLSPSLSLSSLLLIDFFNLLNEFSFETTSDETEKERVASAEAKRNSTRKADGMEKIRNYNYSCSLSSV